VSLQYLHEQPCSCTSCEHIRRCAYRGPGAYRAVGAHGAATWTLDAFLWGPAIPAGQLVYVQREVKRSEKGGHVEGVVIWPLEDGADFSKATRLCTSKRWLEPA
jgi:hypothetical protein